MPWPYQWIPPGGPGIIGMLWIVRVRISSESMSNQDGIIALCIEGSPGLVSQSNGAEEVAIAQRQTIKCEGAYIALLHGLCVPPHRTLQLCHHSILLFRYLSYPITHIVLAFTRLRIACKVQKNPHPCRGEG